VGRIKSTVKIGLPYVMLCFTYKHYTCMCRYTRHTASNRLYMYVLFSAAFIDKKTTMSKTTATTTTTTTEIAIVYKIIILHPIIILWYHNIITTIIISYYCCAAINIKYYTKTTRIRSQAIDVPHLQIRIITYNISICT